MKFLFLTFLLFCCLNSFSQVSTHLLNGNFTNNFPKENPTNNITKFQESIFGNKYYLWIQFNKLPDILMQKAIKNEGIELLHFLPKNTYIASFPLNFNFEILYLKYNVFSVMQIPVNSKFDPTLFNEQDIQWAINGDKIKINFSVVKNIERDELMEIFVNKDLTDIKGFSNSKMDYNLEKLLKYGFLQIEIKKANLFLLSKIPVVYFIEPIQPLPVLENLEATSSHRTGMMDAEFYSGSKKLTGAGITVAIGDDGQIGPHIDFKGRLENRANNAAASNTHSDHCSGIIAGRGNFDPQTKGNAPGAKIITYDFYDDFDDMDDLQNMDNCKVTSHSLGQACNSGYNSSAIESDNLSLDFPKILNIHSAGNSGAGSCGGIAGGWKTITGGFKAGKNVIAVGAITKSDALAGFSSKGPVNDRRIKPDIAAVGAGVESTQPNNTYAFFSGTSMACPGVVGTIALLNQGYNKTHPSEADNALMKAIVLNTADDIGNIGPDFSFGWGKINARRALACMDENRFFSNTINAGQAPLIHNITIPANVATAKIMVYWNDEPGTAGAAISLVNDLNSKLKLNASTFLPWEIDAGIIPTSISCNAPAIKGVDSINNVEQIQIDNPINGVYELEITGNIATANQKYYVIYEFLYKNDIVVTYPFGGETFSIGETQKLRWDASENTGNFSVEYSVDAGNTYNIINNSVNGNIRQQDWVIPNNITGKALIKISRNGFSDISDTSFNIINVPTNLQFNDICPGTVKLTWNIVNGANNYFIYKLGVEKMEKIGQSFTNDFTITGLTAGEINWFAVCARKDNETNGRRSLAASYTATGTSTLTAPIITASTTVLCAGSAITLSILPTTNNIQWQKNGIDINLANATSLVVNTIGNYTCKIFITGAPLCSATSLPIVISTINSPIISANGPLTFCSDKFVVFTASIIPSQFDIEWYKNGNLILGANSNNLNTNETGNYFVKIINELNNTCTAQSTIETVVVNTSPIAIINEGTAFSICEGKNTTISTTTTNAFQWYFNSTPIVPNLQNITIFSSGIYSLKITSSNSCEATSLPFVLTVNNLPDANILPNQDTTLCLGGTIKLNALAGNNLVYNWFKDNNLQISNNNIFDVNETGNYFVNVKNNITGCEKKSVAINITLSNPPKIFAGADTVLIKGQNYQLTVKELTNLNINMYQWQPAFLFSNANVFNPIIKNIQADVQLIVEGKNDIGCSATDTVKLKVFKGPDLYVPNIFTPNNDGLNDKISCLAIGIKSFNYFRIFDRYGKIVFETNNPISKWDGKIGGKFVNAGNYIWIASAIDYLGKSLNKKGNIIIIY